MIEKPNSTRGVLETYRPMDNGINSAILGIFTEVIGARISDWMEKEEILGEMQKAFRQGLSPLQVGHHRSGTIRIHVHVR